MWSPPRVRRRWQQWGWTEQAQVPAWGFGLHPLGSAVSLKVSEREWQSLGGGSKEDFPGVKGPGSRGTTAAAREKGTLQAVTRQVRVFPGCLDLSSSSQEKGSVSREGKMRHADSGLSVRHPVEGTHWTVRSVAPELRREIGSGNTDLEDATVKVIFHSRSIILFMCMIARPYLLRLCLVVSLAKFDLVLRAQCHTIVE